MKCYLIASGEKISFPRRLQCVQPNGSQWLSLVNIAVVSPVSCWSFYTSWKSGFSSSLRWTLYIYQLGLRPYVHFLLYYFRQIHLQHVKMNPMTTGFYKSILRMRENVLHFRLYQNTWGQMITFKDSLARILIRNIM